MQFQWPRPQFGKVYEYILPISKRANAEPCMHQACRAVYILSRLSSNAATA
jgi:hypothetical protein